MRKITDSLYDNFCSEVSLLQAWNLVRHGSHCTTERQVFERNIDLEIKKLHHELVSGHYHHSSYRHITIFDKKRREIHIPHFRDRLVHAALFQQCFPFIEHRLSRSVYSGIQNRGVDLALRRLQKLLQSHDNVHVWHGDVKKCFPSVSHEVTVSALDELFEGDRWRRLFETLLVSFSPGLPLGNLSSQIFIHAVLMKIDRVLFDFGLDKKYIRYGDDYFVVGSSDDCQFASQSVIQFAQTLNLQLHQKFYAQPPIYALGRFVSPYNIRLPHQLKNRIFHNLHQAVMRCNAGEISVKNLASIYSSYRSLHTIPTDRHYYDQLRCILLSSEPMS